jgi:hypothetical protein
MELAAKIERVRALMEQHIPEATVEDYEALVGQHALPDDGDRHVLAAAIKGAEEILVTANLKLFPAPAPASRPDVPPSEPCLPECASSHFARTNPWAHAKTIGMPTTHVVTTVGRVADSRGSTLSSVFIGMRLCGTLLS